MNALAAIVRLLTGRRLVSYEGKITLEGITAPIEILRDDHAIPTIRAKSDEDVWFGLGFALAQDRAGQLELLVRVVRGTLAEVAGENALPIDRLSRRIGFRRAAAAQLAVMRPEVNRQIAAFCRGINAGLKYGANKRAHELLIFGSKGTLWEPADSHALSVFLCFALASNWDAELARFEILHRDGPEALRAVDVAYPEHLPTSRPPFEIFGPCVERLEQDLALFASLVPIGGASNAWAISPSRSRTGRAIVAGDPHLDPAIPSHWYLAHLISPSFHARGALFAGIPAIAAGHNEHVAWSVTAAHADNTDLFFETIGADGKSVRDGQGFVPCEVRRETIRVRGKNTPVIEDVLITPRGPLIGPALDGAPHGISISAAWLAPRPYLGLLGAHTAKDVASFQELFREGSTSLASLVAADTSGRIGWNLAVEAPVRKSGNGILVQPGWSDGWSGELVPFEILPRVIDPPSGFVATANNAPGGEVYFGVDWLDGYRQRAIVDALFARHDWDRARTQALQKNVRSIPWEEMRAVVLAAPVTDDDGRRAARLLSAWDGALDSGSAAASIYVLFTTELIGEGLRAKAPKSAERILGRGFNPILPTNTLILRRLGHLSRLVREQPAGWFGEGWPAAIARVLSRSVAILRQRFGDDEARWSWGQVRPLRLVHALGKESRVLDRVFGRGPYPFGGDASTIAQGTVNLLDPLANPIGAPTLRMFVDVGKFEESRFALLGGQSGNPFSPHYVDQVEAWAKDGLALAWTLEDVERTTRATLTLSPVSS